MESRPAKTVQEEAEKINHNKGDISDLINIYKLILCDCRSHSELRYAMQPNADSHGKA